jgi:hypothetical protein
MTWLNGWEHAPVAGVTGGQWADDSPDRVVLHRTEGSSIEGAMAAYGKTKDEPHGTLDLAKRRKAQHLPLDRSATAVRNLAGGVETNRVGRCIQLEIVGFSANPAQSGDELRFLAQALADIKAAGVDFQWTAPQFHPYPPENGIRLDGREPWRMSFAAWRSFNGICGHQHVPENVHGDPGAIDIQAVIRFATGGTPATAIHQEDDMGALVQLADPTHPDGKGNPHEVWCLGSAGRWYVATGDAMALLQFSGIVSATIGQVSQAALDGIHRTDAPDAAPAPTPVTVSISDADAAKLATAVAAALPHGDIDTYALAAAVVKAAGASLANG